MRAAAFVGWSLTARPVAADLQESGSGEASSPLLSAYRGAPFVTPAKVPPLRTPEQILEAFGLQP